MSGKVVGDDTPSVIVSRKNTDIPSGSRKMVQSLKEIVDCPEAEIYAVLKDCNMDPNEAVSRLLSQDVFHEVKSKKEKKKETKDIPDSRQRGYGNSYNRGNRGGSDRYGGRSGATASFSSSGESGSYQGKTANKRETGVPHTSQGSFSSTSGISSYHQKPHSDAVSMESKTPPITSGGVISAPQSVTGHQTAWFGAPGQMSMADIVKKGIPQNVPTNSRKNVNTRSELNHDHESAANQHVPVKDEWPSIEKPVAASTSSVSVAPTESEVFNSPADIQSSRGDQHSKGQLEDTHLAENGPVGNLGREHMQPDTVAGGAFQEDDFGVSSEFDDNPYRHQTQSHPAEHLKDEENVSSVAANLQELSIENRDHYSSHDEERPAVVIPNHLLINTEECSQLSFGSFGSRPLSNSLEEASDVAQHSERVDARNIEFYGDEHHGSMSNGNMVHVSTENYDDPSESQREVLLPENPETAHQENQYSFPQSEPEYAYDNAKQQLNTAFDVSQTSMQNQMQNLDSFTNQGYTHSVPNNLLAQTAQGVRELELQYSTFPGVQSMPSRSNDSSLGGQSLPMPEALRGTGTPTTQSNQQNLPGSNIATGPALPQQLAMHPYSQPPVPMAHYANMMGYPLMPQSYPYMPSAFQQALPGNSSYHQSLAALLPQYKNNISASNLPQSATSPATTSSAYGFGNSSNGGAGNFPLNQQQQQATPTGATLSYEDVLNLQYKQNSHLLSLQQQQQQQQQNEMPVWLHGPGSQTMSGVPNNTYYNLQAQQQAQQLRQAQQQAQQYGSLGYQNYYQSQTGMSMEHQQQNPRDGGSQGQPSKQTQQQQQQHLWQNSY